MNDVAISNDPNVQTLRDQLEKRLGSFAEALPSHITPEQFKATLIRAAMGDANLLLADRVSFFEAALAAAIDGLMPDKKEGAMVVYNTKIKENGKDIWIKKVQWMPMIRGIFSKVYNTGLVKSATVGIVYGGDQFRSWTDDDGEHLFHEEAEEQDRKVIRRIYAQVVMKAGGCFVDTMRSTDIEKVRQSSKNKDSGPWADWWEEMAFKTVFRHLSKRLPFSREITPLLDRDNFLYDLAAQARDITPAGARPRGIGNRLDALVGITDQSGSSMPMEKLGEKQGEKEPAQRKNSERKPAEQRQQRRDNQRSDDRRNQDNRDDGGDGDQSEDAAAEEAAAYRAGREARAKEMSRKAIPAEFKKDEALTTAWLEGFDEEGN
ncbi:recombinase, phage RecT family [Rhizobium leguminosarum bv. trifolii WSM597]|uniref:Recombinase, phage RecT family n=1 Tax=Rhizobium leguminosarum bv. trifolii WSM597 TaxID=754764 RepID=J0GZ13_RHILT|nr:recombinase RecT [Rhizobium leguminosarum]EJB02935.1 recombinase, phage RecT family [Rhizobium leguminosarum bv. trifolii WSM597]